MADEKTTFFPLGSTLTVKFYRNSNDTLVDSSNMRFCLKLEFLKQTKFGIAVK